MLHDDFRHQRLFDAPIPLTLRITLAHVVEVLCAQFALAHRHSGPIRSGGGGAHGARRAGRMMTRSNTGGRGGRGDSDSSVSSDVAAATAAGQKRYGRQSAAIGLAVGRRRATGRRRGVRGTTVAVANGAAAATGAGGRRLLLFFGDAAVGTFDVVLEEELEETFARDGGVCVHEAG